MATYPLDETYADGDVLAAANVNAITEGVNDLAIVVTNEETASYTLALTDAARVVEMNVATANNLTVPPNSTVAFPIGTQIVVLQTGAGQTTIVAGSGVTVNSADAKLKLAKQWAAATLVKRGTNSWVAIGNLA